MAVLFKRAHRLLVAAVLAVAVAPAIGAILRRGRLPPEFGVFPPFRAGAPKPGFNPFVFGAGVLCALVIVGFYLVPRLFGFRPRRQRPRRKGGALPWWFWAGLAMNLTSWILHWWGSIPIAAYTFIPLWWSFIVTIDGIVYARTGGRSLLATETRRLIVIALVSIPAWAFFEFLNYYAVEFWVYPNNQLFSPGAQALWYLLSFSVVLPGIFEWFTLLQTSDRLWSRWSHGPVWTAHRRSLVGVLLAGGAAMVLFGAYPFELFPLLWMGPPLVLTGALAALRFWTPFRPITRGNWSPVAIVGLASFANGIFWELWNEGSRVFHAGQITNPNYWTYQIPYVDFHCNFLFSEMPLLGYFGYLPFGFLAWVCWLVAAHILDLNPSFDLTRRIDSERAATKESGHPNRRWGDHGPPGPAVLPSLTFP